MILYRIAREKYARDLSGTGGLISSARWHNRMPVIYASFNSSTCILEKLVHLAPDEIHNDLMIITLELDYTIASEKLSASQLPGNWKEYPPPPLLQNIGNAWLRTKSSVLLFVPSVIDPLAENALLNPMHGDISSINIKDVTPFAYDERLLFPRPGKH
jgi:RES domain-containing protein